MESFKKSDALSGVVKSAVVICNRPDMKTKILCAPGSEYDRMKKRDVYNKSHYRRDKWNEIIERNAKKILESSDLADHLKEKAIAFVLLIGMRMLTWAEYHEGTLGFSRGYSVNFLKSSLFTKQGIIDNKKAAEELMKDARLNMKQKYKLACLYCFTDRIHALYKQIAKEDFYDAEIPERIQQPKLVKFWSYYLMDDIDKLKADRNFDQYRLETAIQSGSKTAVEYCLEQTKLSEMKDVLVEAALEAVRCRAAMGSRTDIDWIVFRNSRYNDGEETWVPSDYYVDILCFLISKMGEDQKIKFLKKDIEDAEYKSESVEGHRRSRVLEYFLKWPYQDYFLKTVDSMWEFLPERDYAVLLVKICSEIEFKYDSWKYGEEESYNYRALLKEFWQRSPEHYKMYVFSKRGVVWNSDKDKVKAGVQVIIDLLTLRDFTNEDSDNVLLILKSVAGKEKENIISSNEWQEMCFSLIEEEEWETLDRFVQHCFLSRDEGKKFKKELSFTEGVKCICREYFIVKDMWNAVESFLKWSSLLEDEIKKLKKEIIDNQNGRYVCLDLIAIKENVTAADKFIKWSFCSSEGEKAFRKELVFSEEGILRCVHFVKYNLELASEFINFFLSSEGEVRELKKQVADRFGSSICRHFISEDISDENYIRPMDEFEGGCWEELEQFLTWCFLSEEEITDFKKSKLNKETIKEIHFILINYSQWAEAEIFFNWLGLSTDEIKKLKKETLFNSRAYDMFICVMNCNEDEIFDAYSDKQEAMELLLRWHLSDKETVLEFQEKICHSRQFDIAPTKNQESFKLAIINHLKDLDEEERGVKRKPEFLAPERKRHYNSKIDNNNE